MHHPTVSSGWTLPTTMHVFERGWLSSNNILLFDDQETATLIDTGYVSHREQTLELVKRRLDGRQLARIVNTHLHSDHCGGNAFLQQHLGARIAIPPGHAEAVARWDVDELTFEATGQRCDPFRHDQVLEPGSTLRAGELDWQVLASPGHDPHSVMLWNVDERILISADVLWQHGFGSIFPEIEGDSGFAEQAAMLDLIGRMAPRVVLPGHGAPFADVDAALERARHRLAALASDPSRNARQVAKTMIKFYLLEVRSLSFDALVAHFAQARYFAVINERYFGIPLPELIERCLGELAAVGAVERTSGRVVNRDH